MGEAGNTHVQVRRFLAVGATTVGIDYTVYSLLLFADVPVSPAKAAGFVTGTVFAYFANRLWTFATHGGLGRIIGFMVVYGISLGVNVSLNNGALALLGYEQLAVVLAFLVATAVSASLNFLGMKFLVFKT